MRIFRLKEEPRIVLVTVAAVLLAYAAVDIHDRYSMTGIASWYGRRFMGKTTANGEIFDPEQFTAAHRRLGMGTVVRVTDLKSKRQVIVRINDRGPYIPGRIIDLSRAAARQLGTLEKGLTWVRIEILRK